MDLQDSGRRRTRDRFPIQRSARRVEALALRPREGGDDGCNAYTEVEAIEFHAG